MRTGDSRADDLTAKARILDAALYCFARDGFAASVRTIAQRAEVSAPLVTFHYGTKDALRQACDERVLERYSELKLGALADPLASMGALLRNDVREASVMAVYMIRCFQVEGGRARLFFDRFVDHVRVIMAQSQERGLVKPSRDEEARTRLLAAQAIGQMVVEFSLDPPADPADFWDHTQGRNHAVDAMMELYTDGVFTSHELFDAYVASRSQPDATQQPPTPL